MRSATMKKNPRPTPKKWSLYLDGKLAQESDSWNELYSSAQYHMIERVSVWLIKNGSVTL